MPLEETYESDDVRCPYCLELQSDSWELGGDQNYGITDCGCCGKEFIWERVVTVSFKGAPSQN